MSDPSNVLGIGTGLFLVGVLFYLGVIALSLWIGYLIMRTAVKNGILLADQERARRGAYRGGPNPQPPGSPHPYQ